MEHVCKICNQPVTENSHFWKLHKIPIERYYREHFPKFDKLTKQPIPFKSPEQYLNQDFLTKDNLRLWLESQSLELKNEYCKSLIQKRIDQKSLFFSLGHLELKTLMMPPFSYLDSLFKQEGGYFKVCESLGLKSRYKNLEAISPFKFKAIKTIYTDTREQIPIVEEKTDVKKLDFGDYTSDLEDVFIERKSLVDFINSFGSDFERVSRELQKCLFQNKYMVVLVEESLSKCLKFNEIDYLSKKIKVTPDFVFHNVRAAIQDYKVQFVFANGRREAERLLPKILRIENIEEIELQLAYEKGLI